jgi:hypothetical protein
VTSATNAQTTKSAPPTTGPAFTVLRYEENWSFLNGSSQRTDLFDPIKYIPLGDDSYLSFGGQARYRYEYFNNNNFGAGPQDDDGYHLTRLLLHADLHVGQNFRFFVQGKSAMIDGREGGPRASDADEIDIQQAFVDGIVPLSSSDSLTLRVGRQGLIYGAQRLIGPLDWANIQRTFEGAKFTWKTPQDTLDLFWVRPVLVDKEEPNDGDGNASFAGAYNITALPNLFEGANSKLESYFLALNRSGDPTTPTDSDTYTLGLRFTTNPKPWDFDIEPSWQFGNTGGESIAAYSLAMEAGYTFEEVMFTPRPFIGFDIASGSADGTERFNQLFPTGHLHFGYIDVVARQNIIDIHPGVTVKFTKDLALRAEDHTFWRQNTNDGLYNSAGSLLRGDTGTDASYIGNEIDLLLTWQLNRHTNVQLGYSHFFAGDFLSDTGPSQDIDFAYAQFAFTF